MTFSILPLIQPELSKTEIQTFSSLIDCMFETNVESEENEKESRSNKSSDKIFTAQDLLMKLNKANNLEAMDIDEELNTTDMQTGEEQKKYGIWTLLPGKYRFVLQNKTILDQVNS